MKKVNKLFWGCMAIGLLITITGCATFNNENYAKGAFFHNVITKYIDPSIPIEDHCYLITITHDTYNDIGSINGKSVSFRDKIVFGIRDIVILPPGTYVLNVDYILPDGRYAKSTMTTRGLEAGHYYFIEAKRESNQVRFNYDDINNYSEILVYGNKFQMMFLPVSSVIQGINTKISSVFSGFTPRR